MKIYCNAYNKYRKSKNSKMSYILEKYFYHLSIVYRKCGHEYKK